MLVLYRFYVTEVNDRHEIFTFECDSDDEFEIEKAFEKDCFFQK
jgi:hypothetical protein